MKLAISLFSPFLFLYNKLCFFPLRLYISVHAFRCQRKSKRIHNIFSLGIKNMLLLSGTDSV